MVSLQEAKIELENLKAQILDVQVSSQGLREIEVSLIRIGSAVEKMSGSKDLNHFISEVNRLIWTVRMAQVAIHALEVASGPIGWLYAGATVIGLAAMGSSLMMEVNSH